jgi:uncharacterized protein (DUF1501 family)
MTDLSRRRLFKLAGWCGCGAALRSVFGPSLLLAEGACNSGPGKAIVSVVLNGGLDGLFAFQPLHSGMRQALAARRPQLVLPTWVVEPLRYLLAIPCLGFIRTSLIGTAQIYR